MARFEKIEGRKMDDPILALIDRRLQQAQLESPISDEQRVWALIALPASLRAVFHRVHARKAAGVQHNNTNPKFQPKRTTRFVKDGFPVRRVASKGARQ
jgi:hypothetical protein